MTGSDEFSQTAKEEVDENESISSTISSTSIKLINQDSLAHYFAVKPPPLWEWS